MGRWYQVSPLLEPELALRSCSHQTHTELINALRSLGAEPGMRFCKSVAHVGYYWNDILLNQLSAWHLYALCDILPSTIECLRIRSEIHRGIEARIHFRARLRPELLLVALVRDRLKTQLEDLLDGDLCISRAYEYAAKNGIKDKLKPVISDFFKSFSHHHDKPDTRLIITGCMDVDRIL